MRCFQSRCAPFREVQGVRLRLAEVNRDSIVEADLIAVHFDHPHQVVVEPPQFPTPAMIPAGWGADASIPRPLRKQLGLADWELGAVVGKNFEVSR